MKLKISFRGMVLLIRNVFFKTSIESNLTTRTILILLVPVVLLLPLDLNAQTYHQLKVGDTIPEVNFTSLINSDRNEIKLSGFRGKLLLLDFWATWCTSCLHHFPALDSIQHELGSRLQILLVDTKDTRDTRERISATLSRFNGSDGKRFSLPTVYNDTILNRLFPHFEIPHFVWIDSNGKVQAITAAEEVTEKSLVSFLYKSKTPSYQKKDFDPHRPLYTDASLPLNTLQQYSIFLRGKTDGIGQGGLRRINDTVRGLIAHNQSLFWIYRLILDAKIPGLNDNRLLIEVKDPSKLLYVKSRETKLQWERKNDYSYELIVPKDKVNHLYDYALSELNKYTAYKACIEYRDEDCWILERLKHSTVPHDTTGKYINELESADDARLCGSTPFNLCLFINEIGGGNLIVLDKTGIKDNLCLNFKQPVKSIRTLQRRLPKFGLRLIHQKRTIAMMVIHDKHISNLN